jgi:S1 RNA binding domain protein
MSITVGKIVEGEITGITNFGAFIKLENGKTGLCHISEVSDDYVKDIKNYLTKGDTVKVKIIKIEGDKISLSIKAAKPKEEKKSPKPKKQKQYRGPKKDFEDLLDDFMKESSQKLQEVQTKKNSRKGNNYNKN